MRFVVALVFALLIFGSGARAEVADIQLVSFTAEWCPNCKVLNPKMEQALDRFSPSEVEHVVLDMTDDTARFASYDLVDGTILAGVYGDYLGLTGIGILTAPDSGEKIGCIDREHSVEEIVSIISKAREIVLTQAPLQRQTGLGDCPAANDKIAL